MRSFRTFLLALACITGLSSRAQLTSTNLPIVIITAAVPLTDNQVDGNMKIIDNTSGTNTPGDSPAFNGLVGLKLRGSSTNPKKSYSIETWVNLLEDPLNVSLMGMPAENDWVLLAEYTDRSLLRDLTGFYIYNQMGYYSARMRLCEVIVNEGTGDQYKGVYLFGEKIKRDVSRVDIATLQPGDNSGEEITGGYIFTIDEAGTNANTYWTSLHQPPFASGSQNIKFLYEEPKWDEITGVQKAWIQTYVRKFEDSLASANFQDTGIGWRGFAAIKWFRDFFIYNEVMKDEDAYRKNIFLYKDKSKKLRIGPPWSHERSLYNTADCNASQATGFAYNYGQTCGSSTYLPPFWWQRLMNDTAFVTELKCRYTQMRNDVLDTLTIFNYIDSVDSMLNVTQGGGTPQGRNFTEWQIFGVPLTNEPGGPPANYPEEISRIKTFIKDRLAWLDTQWYTPGCVLGIKQLLGDEENSYISPNPASGEFTTHIMLTRQTAVSVTVRNLQGAVVYSCDYKLGAGEHQLRHNISKLAPSMYIITLQQDDHTRNFKLVKN